MMDYLYCGYRITADQNNDEKPTSVKIYDTDRKEFLKVDDDEVLTAWVTAKHMTAAMEANYISTFYVEQLEFFARCLLLGYRQKVRATRENPEIGRV